VEDEIVVAGGYPQPLSDDALLLETLKAGAERLKQCESLKTQVEFVIYVMQKNLRNNLSGVFDQIEYKRKDE
jgi:hypothetical protein